MRRYVRWISYTQQNIPGGHTFDLKFHYTLEQAKDFFHAYCTGVGNDDCSMTLYATPSDPDQRNEMISQAMEYSNIGCPFDYPDKIVQRGPLGGIKIVNA